MGLRHVGENGKRQAGDAAWRSFRFGCGDMGSGADGFAAGVVQNDTVLQGKAATDEDVFNALGRQGGIGEGGTVPDGLVVKNGDVRVCANIQPTLVRKAKTAGGEGGDLLNGIVQT